jgi:hypothetical protein
MPLHCLNDGFKNVNKNMTSSSSIIKKKYRENPFTTGTIFSVPVRSRGEKIHTTGPLQLVDSHTGEVMDAAVIQRTKIVDSDRFVKLFVSHLNAFFDLKPGTVRMMMALIDELSQGRNAHGDTIYLNYSRVREYFDSKDAKPPAKATFFSAMAELTEKGFVAPSVDTNLWFINPAIFFNGDRVKFVTELRRKRASKSQELEAAGQQALPFDGSDSDDGLAGMEALMNDELENED